MLRLLADEHISWALIDGMLARLPGLDLIRVMDVGLGETDDRKILEWAAHERRVIVTEDHATMIGYVYKRVFAGGMMAGAITIEPSLSLSRALEDLHVVAYCYSMADMVDRVEYIPLNPPLKPRGF